MVAWAIDAVWDIECAQWDQFLCGALWTRANGIEVFRTPDGLADALMSLPKGSQAWAHAGGKYDVLWLIDHLASVGRMPRASVSMSGASATSVRIKDGPWLRDSARLVPMSLARAAKIAGPNREKGDPGIAFEDMHQGMTKSQWDRVIHYMVGDVELLRDVLLAIAEYAQSQGIELRGTVGGTAWATATKWCELDQDEWDTEVYQAVRPGYYGGLCAVHRTEEARIWRYDRKSAYPASLMEPLPVGAPTVHDTTKAARRAFAAGRPGVYNAHVLVSDSLAPPLPIRHRNRLAYPHGTVHGVWTHVELQHAVDCGARVEDIYTAVTWPGEAPRLASYAKRCFDLRDSLPKAQKDALGIWLKFLANSLTGKLGQSPENRIVALGDYADAPGYELVGSSPWVWSRNSWRLSSCAQVHWAGVLTARARVELHSQILHAGDSWVYSDTDSVFATRPLTRRIGEELGEWACEGEGLDWRALAPKVYAYRDVEKGKDVAHAKGVPGARDGDTIAKDVWDRYTAGERIESDRGVKSLLIAARDKDNRLFVRRKLSRGMNLTKNREWCGARLRDGNVTRAPNVSDLARLK